MCIIRLHKIIFDSLNNLNKLAINEKIDFNLNFNILQLYKQIHGQWIASEATIRVRTRSPFIISCRSESGALLINPATQAPLHYPCHMTLSHVVTSTSHVTHLIANLESVLEPRALNYKLRKFNYTCPSNSDQDYQII